MIEFVFVGIPMIFVLISIFEVARGMWLYHTLAYAIKEGARYAMVHGENCYTSPNSCAITVRDVVSRIQQSGVGLIPQELGVVLRANNSTVSCMPDLVSSGCWTLNQNWPTYPNNQPGMYITITGYYPFYSAIAMFWPGTKGTQQFGKFTFVASSQEAIQF
jgi:Flp pilus assembly protein TadG